MQGGKGNEGTPLTNPKIGNADATAAVVMVKWKGEMTVIAVVVVPVGGVRRVIRRVCRREGVGEEKAAKAAVHLWSIEPQSRLEVL